MNDKFDECIRSCLLSARLCEESHAHSMVMDLTGLEDCTAASRDCADICLLTMQLMARASDLRVAAARLCADACDRCARECEREASSQGGHDRTLLERCAASCRETARHCDDIAGGVAESVPDGMNA